MPDPVAATMREALAASEDRLRLLAERSKDVIFRYRVSPTPAFEYLSPSIERLSGYTQQELYDNADIAFAMIHPEDRAEFQARLADGRLFREPIVARWIRRDGATVWTEQTNIEILDHDGRRIAVEGVARDATLAAEASAAIVQSESRFRSALVGIRLHAVLLDREGRIVFANPYLLERTGWTEKEIIGRSSFEVFLPEATRELNRAAFLAAVADESIASSWETEWLTCDRKRILIAWSSSFIRDATGAIVGIASVGEDVTERRRIDAHQVRLTAAVGHAVESILVTDVDGRITDVNAAFERSVGVTAADAIGRRPWAIARLRPEGARIGDIVRRLRTNGSWSGEWQIDRPDASIGREEVSITPIRDDEGTVSGFVSVARDVTQIRAMQAILESTQRQRAAVAEALSSLSSRDTAEESATAIVAAIVAVPGADIATILTFEGEADVACLAVSSPGGYPVGPGALVPAARAAYLRARAAAGPWADQWPLDSSDPYEAAVAATGIRAVAFAPWQVGGDIGGIVAIGTASAAGAERIDDQISTAIEFAATARGFLGTTLLERREVAARRLEIATILDRRAFRPVFQPVVNVDTGAAIGYEALTRFDDGTAPDRHFADALRAGLAVDLEAVTLELAVADSLLLPAGPWVSLNLSAEMILAGDRLANILRRRTRPVVLEITEHDAIHDYGAVRAAVAALGPDVRIAVDDAGAGVANFTHIVQLRPDFVKIDASLVRGVNNDLTRQALIVGLQHFARATNGWLIAEGVETEEERACLRGLELTLGQGYLFGRPSPVETWESPRSTP